MSIELLRKVMKQKSVAAYIVPTSDYHNSEYVDDYFKCREYLSGFTGSNGTLVVTEDEAGLWTDGRYYIQAEAELEGSGITLFRSGEVGVPRIIDYLASTLKAGEVCGFDGRTIPASTGRKYEDKLAENNVSISYEEDLVAEVWDDRPMLPNHPVYSLDDDNVGVSAKDKISSIRAFISDHNADSWLCTRLDDIMWLLNIRGADVECNPVALSYFYLTQTEAHLFIQLSELDSRINEYFDHIDVTIHDYAQINDFIKSSLCGRTLVDLDNLSYTIYKLVSDKSTIISVQNPTERLKAIKNETELAHLREAYIRDSAALTRFIYWLKSNAGKEDLSEISVAEVLDGYRRQLPGFIDLSFPTISAYADNAAIVHYEATEKTNKRLEAKGMYLVDSGGQYLGGTTDVTRTIVLGDVSDEMKEHFTYVAVGMLRLADTHFIEGCTGRNIDIIARDILWRQGLDYKHGTGHGIGYILNVHEGPQNVRWKYLAGAREAILEEGMIVSDEPGLYIEGKYGIRTENILEICSLEENEYGKFLGFKHLTYVPIDLQGIDTDKLDRRDVELLNDYHRMVREKILMYMETQEEREWLIEVTCPI